MIRLSRLSDYAVLILQTLSCSDKGSLSASEISEHIGLAESTVSKILKQLTKHGIIESRRGIKGGYALHKSKYEITVNHIITAIDGPIAITHCQEGSGHLCELSHKCGTKQGWDKVNKDINQVLDQVTLAHFSEAS